MVLCIFLLFGSYFKLFYLPWTAQEELCCALSSADSGKCQLCCSSVSNMFLEQFKNSTVWNISIFSLLDENWGGVNSLLLHCFTRARSCAVFRCSGTGASYWCWERQHDQGTWSEPELKKIPAVVRASSRPGTCGSCVSAGHSRTSPQSYSAIPFLLSAGAPHHWLLGLCLVFIGISFLSCSVLH